MMLFQHYAETASYTEIFCVMACNIIFFNVILYFSNSLIMVMIVIHGYDLMQEVERVLRSCLADVPFVQIEDTQTEPAIDGKPDMLLRLRLPNGSITLVLEVKSNGQPRFARNALNQLEFLIRDIPNAYGIFVAPYISQDVAELCYQRNIGYLDLAGNSRLSFWPVYIKTSGAGNPYAMTRELRSLYSPTSKKTTTILRFLLENPKRIWRIQELANAAKTSLGQMSNVKKQLENREWLQSDTKGFWLTDPVELLTDWSRNYELKRNKISDFYSMKSIPLIETELADLCARENIKYALTGFSGGARYAPVVRYQRASAYIADDAVNRVAVALGLKEVSSGANVSLISPYDPIVFHGLRCIDGACIASPTQVYLDLQSIHGRGEEAAAALLKKEIEPQWR